MTCGLVLPLGAACSSSGACLTTVGPPLYSFGCYPDSWPVIGFHGSKTTGLKSFGPDRSAQFLASTKKQAKGGALHKACVTHPSSFVCRLPAVTGEWGSEESGGWVTVKLELSASSQVWWSCGACLVKAFPCLLSLLGACTQSCPTLQPHKL